MMTTANVPHDDELDVPHFEIPVFDHVEFANTKFDMSTRFNENNLKKNQTSSVFDKQNLVAAAINNDSFR